MSACRTAARPNAVRMLSSGQTIYSATFQILVAGRRVATAALGGAKRLRTDAPRVLVRVDECSMRVVNRKRLLAPAAAILGVVAIFFAMATADSRAIRHRGEMANSLRRTSNRLEQRSLNDLLHELGQPKSMSFRPHVGPQRAGGPQRPAYLDLRYEYQFRATPWSHPYTVSVRVAIEMPSGRVESMSVDETYGS